MPEYHARSQKAVLSLEGLRDYLWCLPLPFLMGLDVGYGIYIFGAAYYAALIERQRMRLPALVLAAAGLLFIGTPALRWKYGTLVLLMTVLQGVAEVRFPLLTGRHRALLHMSLLFVSVLLLSLTGIIKQYSFTMLLLEAGLLGGFGQLYSRFLWEREELHPAELSLAAGSFLAAAAVIHWNQLVLSEVALCAASMILARREGSEGALGKIIPAAALMRLTASGSDGLLIWCLLLILTVSLFRQEARWKMAAAAVSASLLYLLLFMNRSLWAGLLTLAGGTAAFLLWPVQLEEKRKTDEEGEWRRYLRYQLDKSADAFRRLAELTPEAAVRDRLSRQDTAYLMENVAGRVCRDCSGKEECWSLRLSRTYETIQQIMTAAGGKGWIEEKDLPAEFVRICPRITGFVQMVNRHYELYRLNLSWENRLSKSRRLIRGQYEILASCLERSREHLIADLKEEREVKRQAERLLRRQGIGAFDIWALADEREDRICISFLHPRPLTDKEEKLCREGFSELTGRTMRLCSVRQERGDAWRSRFQDAHQIQLKSFGLRQEAGRVSGDSYILEPLDEGRYVMALSDGMGTGPQAQKESRRALEMLEQLLLAGAREEEALEMLHTSMVLGENEESFTTLDVALIDLHLGKMRLLKAGGAVTYLQQRGKVTVCRGSSLPVGMLEEPPRPEIFEYPLHPGDRLVMISDGVVDQVEDPRRGEEWIRRYLLRTKTEDPRELAEEIQKGLQSQTERPEVEDDKTVLAAVIGADD